MTERDKRRQLLRELVGTFEIASQGELVELLHDRGMTATQATVSRDLEDLGVGRQRGADGRVRYALPEQSGLSQILRQFAISVEASGNLAVVRTPPGVAAAVASAIDGAGVPGVLATLQGDDTLLVVATEGLTGRALADRLLSIKTGRAPDLHQGA